MNQWLLALIPQFLWGASLALVACNVTATKSDTEGIDLDDGSTDAGTMDGGTQGPRPIRGFAVVNSDYDSLSVSLVGVDGDVESRSIISSSSATTGLSAALGDDLVLASSTVPGRELVLVDRSSAVLSWLDLETAEVRAQLNVSTGFASNPQDYIPISEHKAYVPRFAPNLASGQEDFDGGDDILVVDPAEPEVLGRIDLSDTLQGLDDGLWARPERGLVFQGDAVVTSIAMDLDFVMMAEARVLRIDPESDEVAQVLVLEGMRNCVNLALSPSGEQLAVACTGGFGQDPEEGFPDAGIVLIEMVEGELRETMRFPSIELGSAQINALSYASEESLVFSTYGWYSADGSALLAPDALRRLDLEAGEVDEAPVRESEAAAFVLNEVQCDARARVCVMTDAETEGGRLHVYDVSERGELSHREALELEAGVGLPPRYLGTY